MREEERLELEKLKQELQRKRGGLQKPDGKFSKVIKRCPKCGSLFVKIRRYVYCSNVCAAGHGFRYTPEYDCWRGIKKRCLVKTSRNYARYGGRGIAVCDRWLNSFENFLADMGLKPSVGHSIGRIDNNGNYCPENCRWENNFEQQNNTSGNRPLTLNGVSFNQSEWCRKIGIKPTCLSQRLRSGWTVERALTTPLRKW